MVDNPGASGLCQTGVETETADLLITLLKVGRSIVSERQPLINDAKKGHKGFTDSHMGCELMERFKAETHIDLAQPDSLPQRDLLLAMVQAEREVIFDAQPVINKQGIGFKGFVPSLFARKTGQKFLQDGHQGQVDVDGLPIARQSTRCVRSRGASYVR